MAIQPIEQRGSAPTGDARRLIFISHANPQDNAVAAWFATRLTLLGYEVRCDLKNTHGGESDFWPKVQNKITRAARRLKKDFDCTCAYIDGFSSPKGKVVISYLHRTVDGETLYSEPLPADPEERLSPDSLRRLCRALDVPVAVFGLNLG